MGPRVPVTITLSLSISAGTASSESMTSTISVAGSWLQPHATASDAITHATKQVSRAPMLRDTRHAEGPGVRIVLAPVGR